MHFLKVGSLKKKKHIKIKATEVEICSYTFCHIALLYLCHILTLVLDTSDDSHLISYMMTSTHYAVTFISPSHCKWYSLISQISHQWASYILCWNGVRHWPYKGPVFFKVFHLEKHNAIHEYRITIHPLKERGSVQTDRCTEGIVTRCSGGNTWSIPCWRNVFISLFTNVAISRCVHYKVHCRLDHSIKRSVASMGNLCRGRGYAIWTAGTV